LHQARFRRPHPKFHKNYCLKSAKQFSRSAVCQSKQQHRRQYFVYYQDVLCRIGMLQSVKTCRRLITAKPRPRYRAYHSEPRKMADTRPTFPLSQRYTQRKQKQFSRPMTGHTPQKLPPFGRNLLHHRSAQRRLRLHALDYDTTETAFCQYIFWK